MVRSEEVKGARGRRRGDLASEVRRSTGFAVAALLTCGLVGLVVGVGLLIAEDRAVEADAADDQLGEVHQAMLDAETGLRGFQLTRDRTFLEPYVSGTAALDRLHPELTSAVAGDSGLTSLWTGTRHASEAWRAGWAQPTVAAGGERPAGRPIDGGRVLFDEYRTARAALEEALEARSADAYAAQRVLLIAGLVLSAVVGAVSVVVTWRRGNALLRAVVEPVRDLLETVRRMGDGDHTVRPSSGGPEELRRIGEGLAGAAAALETEQQRSRASAHEATSRAADLEVLLELTRTLTAATELDEVLLVAARAAQTRFGAACVRLWLVGEVGLQVGASVGDSTDAGSELAERALLGATVLRDDRGEGTALAVQMNAGDHTVGVLECLGTPGELVGPACVRVLEAMAISTGTAVRSARLHAEAQELARRDGLTGLLNRRVLDADLVRETRHALRHSSPLSVVLLDVDHFKSLNDEHGHAFGDEVLATLGRTLTAELRDGDEAYRYGGEEFAVVLRDTTAGEALVAAERLRSAIRRTFEGVVSDRQVTASYGVADTRSGADAAALLRAADDALYAAKKAGRDRAMLSDRRAPDSVRTLVAVSDSA